MCCSSWSLYPEGFIRWTCMKIFIHRDNQIIVRLLQVRSWFRRVLRGFSKTGIKKKKKKSNDSKIIHPPQSYSSFKHKHEAVQSQSGTLFVHQTNINHSRRSGSLGWIIWGSMFDKRWVWSAAETLRWATEVLWWLQVNSGHQDKKHQLNSLIEGFRLLKEP